MGGGIDVSADESEREKEDSRVGGGFHCRSHRLRCLDACGHGVELPCDWCDWRPPRFCRAPLLLICCLGAWGPEGLGLPDKQDKAVFIVAPATVPPPSSYHPPLPPGSCHHSLSNSFRTKTRDPEDLGGALRECLLCSNDQFLVTNWSNSPS